MEATQGRRNNNGKYLIAALLLLVALNVLQLYLYYQERQTNKTQEATIAAKTEEVFATRAKLDSIANQLDGKIAEITRLGGDVTSLTAAKAQLEADKRELRNVNNFSLRKYEKKIKSYDSLLAEKDQVIAQLKKENGELTAQNQTLQQENSTLKTERQSLNDSVVSFSAQNRELAEKVTVASALRAEAVTVNVLNSRGKERDGGSYKAKKIDKVKVSFRLGDNPLAQLNDKEIYLRILDPSGAVISDMATGSGEFKAKGKEMIYTAAQHITFDNSHQEVSFIYGRGGQRFNPGRHVVELYAESFKIGEGDFTVR